MMYEKAKAIDKVAKVKLEQFLEDLLEEALQMQCPERKALLLGAYSVGQESIRKGTFMLIEDDDHTKYIIVPGIPFYITESWNYKEATV